LEQTFGLQKQRAAIARSGSWLFVPNPAAIGLVDVDAQD
jgi:hypothetical protein